MTLLTRDTIEKRLTDLPGWVYDGNTISKTFVSSSFGSATGFVVQIAIMAEVDDHHPDIDIRYNRVTVTLATHSEGGVTEKDLALAARVEKGCTS